MDLDKTSVFLLLGGNLGNREAHMRAALNLIQEVGEIKQVSAMYETEAWGNTDQPNFLNLAVELTTNLPAIYLLDKLLFIEQEIGRVRDQKWGPRLIDIDIIFYGSAIIQMPNKLVIPHPEMQNRKFVLMPLTEIAPNFKHPIFHKTVKELLDMVDDTLKVQQL